MWECHNVSVVTRADDRPAAKQRYYTVHIVAAPKLMRAVLIVNPTAKLTTPTDHDLLTHTLKRRSSTHR